MMKKYFFFKPSVRGRIEEEWNQCLNLIAGTVKNGYRPLKVNIFISVNENKDYLETRQAILKSVAETLGDMSPAISITVHPPQDPWKIAVEALFLVSGSADVITRYYESAPYVVISTDWGKELWGAGLGSGFFTDDIRQASENAFNNTVDLLAREGMTLNNIIRQWNYIGNILAIRRGLQHYQVFNEVRSEYFSRYRTVTGYPAATGIGMKAESVIIDFCAVVPDGSVKIRGLSNPDQVNAYEYGQKVLKGIKDKGKQVKQPPQFERALIMEHKNRAVLFISGTASIKGQATIGKNDVGEQTRVTLENIKKLADEERISNAMTGLSGHSLKFSLLRVYIKHQDDFRSVSSVCEEQFPEVPVIYIEADVCRDDLLVEIEAEVQVNC